MMATIAVYWLLPARWRDYFLAILSLAFLVIYDWISAGLLVTLTAVSYVVANRGKITTGRILAAAALVIAVLGFYKARASGDPLEVIRDVAIPMGLSYYSFRIIHYLIERARNTLPEHSFGDFICYLFFLPTILVGPIHRFGSFVADRREKTWEADKLSEGMERIVFGYFKITVLGNYLLSGVAAQAIGTIDPAHQPLILYLEAVRGSLNLYMQFSGYSDIAIGFALMLGYRVMENFNWPFLKRNIAEFWRAWHMSLTGWSRDYIYMPTVGVTRSPIIGTFASLLLIGVWHELSVRYVIWGLYQAVGIVFVSQLGKVRRKLGFKPLKPGVPKTYLHVVSVLLTANYFFLGYVIIHQQTLGDILRSYWVILFSWWL
ncbi:MAG: MBOAT family O-acyltransferase [Pseudomonadota bacterium]